MKKILLSISFLSVPLVATKELAKPISQADCENAMRLCAVCCAATSVWGGGMYVGGVLADTSILSTDSVIHAGAGLMCGGLLGAIIGATCPADKKSSDKKTEGEMQQNALLSKPTPVTMKYNSLPQEVVLEELP